MEKPDRNRRIAAATAIATVLATGHEGLKFTPYYDPPGILTVCRGHTGPDVVKSRRYSLQECDAFMDADMRHAVETVERCAPGLPPNVLAAFADAVYNMGPKITCDPANSQAARLLKQGAIPAACEELPRWDKARVAGVLVSLPGLTKRRHEERGVCLGDAA
jgi:GH24 family phage-related lysozyme (muramidase)